MHKPHHHAKVADLGGEYGLKIIIYLCSKLNGPLYTNNSIKHIYNHPYHILIYDILQQHTHHRVRVTIYYIEKNRTRPNIIIWQKPVKSSRCMTHPSICRFIETTRKRCRPTVFTLSASAESWSTSERISARQPTLDITSSVPESSHLQCAIFIVANHRIV